MTISKNPTLKRVSELTDTKYGYVRQVVSERLTNSRKQRLVMRTYRDLLQQQVNELTESIVEEAITDFAPSNQSK